MGVLTILAGLVGLASLGGGYYERQFAWETVKRPFDYGEYRELFPITIPDNPSMKAIAQDIFKSVDASQFMFGGSTSEHQCSKKCTPEVCSWSRYAEQNGMVQPYDSQYSMDWWSHGEAYLDDAREAIPGLNTVRFSTELALLQPTGPDSFDTSVADHYAQRFIAMVKRGITPAVCFHHYTDPNWFMDLGGFEKIENVDYFVDTCVRLYEHIMHAIVNDPEAVKALQGLGARQPKWITFNAPDGYAFRGYFNDGGPPSVSDKKGFKWVAEVLKNTLEAHVRVYHRMKSAFKKMDFKNIEVPQIGFLKNIHQIDAAQFTVTQKVKAPLTNMFAGGFSDQLQNAAVYNFFTKGEFWAQNPLPVSKINVNVKHTNKQAIGAVDFIGLNYYSNQYREIGKQIPITDESLKTDGDTYYHYPYGMYRAIVEIHERFMKPLAKVKGKELPMFVAENGIATQDNKKRERFYREYMYAISQAVKAGYKVYGYLPWCLFDNYEWPAKENNTKRHYGIFAVTEDGKHLELKEGSKPLAEFGSELAAVLSQG